MSEWTHDTIVRRDLARIVVRGSVPPGWNDDEWNELVDRAIGLHVPDNTVLRVTLDDDRFPPAKCPQCDGFQFVDRPHTEVGCPDPTDDPTPHS